MNVSTSNEGAGKSHPSRAASGVNGISATPAWQGRFTGALKVPAEQLWSLLGITDVNWVRIQHALEIVDSTLGEIGRGKEIDCDEIKKGTER